MLLLRVQKFILNQIQRDDFGRPHGLLAIDKPAEVTSHDVVATVRRKLGTKHVGHAGALDPFATGLLIVLVGKATKLSDNYLGQDKEYIAQVLFGISTDSADNEGKITALDPEIDLTGLGDTLQSFSPEYRQQVPVYSSVKVNGQKLRILARSADSFQIQETTPGEFVVRFTKNGHTTEYPLPTHLCRIPEIELLQLTTTNIGDSSFYQARSEQLGHSTEYQAADIRVSCSKGTYIRTLAEDIGKRLPAPAPAMLWQLRRTRIGEIYITQAISVDEVV